MCLENNKFSKIYLNTINVMMTINPDERPDLLCIINTLKKSKLFGKIINNK
jgi:hypothetical protein